MPYVESCRKTKLIVVFPLKTLLKTRYLSAIIYISNNRTNVLVFKREVNAMNCKKIIIEMLDKADDRRLHLIYCYIKAILGLGD